jgi:hypothetical protein
MYKYVPSSIIILNTEMESYQLTFALLCIYEASHILTSSVAVHQEWEGVGMPELNGMLF